MKQQQPIYRGSILAKNSEAFRLWLEWQKTKENVDRAKLDLHMKVVENNYNRSIRDET